MDPIFQWFGDSWDNILGVLLGAVVSFYLTDLLTTLVVRNLVRGRLHGDSSPEDIVKRQNTLIGMFSMLIKVLIVGITFVALLRIFKIDPTPLLAWASILGVALGFGAQSLIKDFISGLFIIIENQYRVGDTVEIGGAIGKVEQITIRSTIMRDMDGNVHYIPNGTVTSSINKTKGYSKVNLVIAVAPNTDVDQLAEIVNVVGEKLASDEKWKNRVLEAPKFVNISNFTGTTLEVNIAGKTTPSHQWSVAGEFRKRLLKEFNKKDVVLAGAPAPAAPAKKKK